MGLGSFLSNFAQGAADQGVRIQDNNRLVRQKMIEDGFTRLSGLYDKSIEQQQAARALSNRADAIVANNPGRVDRQFVVQKLMADPNASEADIVRAATPAGTTPTAAGSSPTSPASQQTSAALGQAPAGQDASQPTQGSPGQPQAPGGAPSPASGQMPDPRVTSAAGTPAPDPLSATQPDVHPSVAGPSLHDILFGATSGQAITDATNKRFDNVFGAGSRDNLSKSASDILAEQNTGHSAFTNRLVPKNDQRVISGAEYNKMHPEQAPIPDDEQLIMGTGADGGTTLTVVPRRSIYQTTNNNSFDHSGGPNIVTDKEGNKWLETKNGWQQVKEPTKAYDPGAAPITYTDPKSNITYVQTKSGWHPVAGTGDKTMTAAQIQAAADRARKISDTEDTALHSAIQTHYGATMQMVNGVPTLVNMDQDKADIAQQVEQRALELRAQGMTVNEATTSSIREATNGEIQWGEPSPYAPSTFHPKADAAAPAAASTSTTTTPPKTDTGSATTTTPTKTPAKDIPVNLIEQANRSIETYGGKDPAKRHEEEVRVRGVLKQQGYTDEQITAAGF
jgi:hypothetical protein